MNWFRKKEKEDVGNKYVDEFDVDKIYNLEQRTIANILVLVLPKTAKSNEEQKKNIAKLVDDTLKFLSKFLNKNLTDENENAKVRNYIENYINNLVIDKTPQNIGLMKIDISDFEKASKQRVSEQNKTLTAEEEIIEEEKLEHNQGEQK